MDEIGGRMMDKKNLIPGETYLRKHKAIVHGKYGSRGLYRMYAGDTGRGSILSERKFAEIEG